MADQSGASLIGDIRGILQDVIAPDLKALSARVDGLEKQVVAVRQDMQLVRQDMQAIRGDLLATRDRLESDIRQLNERQERRFDRLESALDVYKKVQELEEFRIRTEERLKASA